MVEADRRSLVAGEHPGHAGERGEELLHDGHAPRLIDIDVGDLVVADGDPGALWRDTVSYGAGTYRIVGYGLAALLLNLGAIDDRFGNYPFVWLAIGLWLPLTAWLLWAQRRAGTLWAGAIGFSVSMFVLLFLSRVFQSSYLAWPLTGIGLALLLASGERTSPSPSRAGASSSAARE